MTTKTRQSKQKRRLDINNMRTHGVAADWCLSRRASTIINIMHRRGQVFRDTPVLTKRSTALHNDKHFVLKLYLLYIVCTGVIQ